MKLNRKYIPRISFDNSNHWTKGTHFYMELIPGIYLEIDRQMEYGFKSGYGDEIRGVIEYRIGISWLWFAGGICFEFETDKMLEQDGKTAKSMSV